MQRTPPSLQTRVGGINLLSLYENDASNPSLAPNASRRGSPSFFIRKRCNEPLPRFKCEAEGILFIFFSSNIFYLYYCTYAVYIVILLTEIYTLWAQTN